MRCYRRFLLNISYKDHATNEEVRSRIQNAIGVHDDLLTMVKKRKLILYDHISRSSGMAKTMLQGTVKGTRRRGRQKKRWEDQGIDGNGVLRFPEGSGRQERIRYCCNVICGAPTTSKDKGLRWDEMNAVKAQCHNRSNSWANIPKYEINYMYAFWANFMFRWHLAWPLWAY